MKKRFLPYGQLLLVGVISMLVLTGCVTRQVTRTESGFLSNYDGLAEDKDSEGMYVYMNPYVDIAGRYDKILLAPVQFKLDPTVKGRNIKDEDQERMAAYFIEKLKEGLEKNYIITEDAGEDVLLFRTAITDLLPNKVWLNIDWVTTLVSGGIGGASLEAELVDSLTGERMASFIDARKGNTIIQRTTIPNYAKGLTKWGHTQEVLGILANLMVENLDRLEEESKQTTP